MVSRIAFWYMSQFAMPGRPFGRVGSAVKEGEAEEGLPAPRHDKGEGRGRMQLRVDIQVHQGKGGLRRLPHLGEVRMRTRRRGKAPAGHDEVRDRPGRAGPDRLEGVDDAPMKYYKTLR